MSSTPNNNDLGEKLGLLITKMNISDQIKADLAAVLSAMTLVQLQQLAGILENKFNQANQ